MRQRQITYIAIIFAVAILAGYVYLYQVGPLAEEWNNLLIYAADPFAALLAAISVTMVLINYRREDKPYFVWAYFTVAMWVWVIAETIFVFVALSSGQDPKLSAADGFWFIGYFLLSLAIYLQYQLIAMTKIGWWKLAVIWVGVILLSPLLLFLLGHRLSDNDFVENWVAYLYPIVDFAICIVSFHLYIVFGGGKLSRPWVGLLLLGVADLIWAWVNLGGGGDDTAIFVGDVVYVAAYLILAIGFFRQYLLLKYGPD